MRNLLKRLFFKPTINGGHLLLLLVGYMAAVDAYNYSPWLYFSLIAAAWFLVRVITAISSLYFEVVENEFEKSDEQ